MAEETVTPEPEIVKISVFTPLIYVGVVLSIFITFSIIYRKRRLQSLTKVEPLFKENYTAVLYQHLKDQYTNKDLPKDQRPHEKVMKAALLRRAVEAIRRSMKLKENEPVFNKLYQNGLIGDDIFKQYQIQIKFQELELKDIVTECETYKKGWVQTFFPLAQEICFNEALRRRLKALDDRAETFSQLWETYADKSEKSLESAKKVESKKTVEAVKAEETKDKVAEISEKVEDVKEEKEQEQEADEKHQGGDNDSSKSKKKKKNNKAKKN